jgi:DNA-binding NarL/FixJ family response regulator
LIVRVLVVDDRPSARAGLVLLVSAEDDLEAIGEASSTEEALTKARALQPDVIVLDAGLCKRGEIDIVQALAQEHPPGNVLVLSVQDEPQDLREALELGASGYVLKQAVETELVPAIREVAAGRRYAPPELDARFIAAGSRRCHQGGVRSCDHAKLHRGQPTHSCFGRFVGMQDLTPEVRHPR